ncbi:glycosyltransferase [Selenomonas sp.]|uniref:glycosyltransferase n=1 Tax=Selenomonas sp. TaxID=2053611 RepID=UPI003FA3028C
MCHKTSIIILSYNTLELLQLCIASIREFTEAGTYEIIVVENASKDGSIEWLKAQTGLTCIYNEENQGFPGGCNQGLEIAAGTELLLLNSDTVVTKDWLKNLRFALYSSPKVGAVSCVTNHCSNNQRIDVSYESIEAMLAFAADYNRSNPALWEKRTKLVGFCFLFKREVFERVGFLDVRFNPGNYEDDDYSLRILQAGYDLLLCRDTFIHHYGGASFEKKLAVRNAAEMKERYNAALMRNHKIFFEKWQAPEDYWKMAPEELLPYLRRQAPEDVSAASAAQTIAVLVRRTNEERYALCLKSLYAANIPAGYALEIFPLSIERSYAAQVNEVLARTTAKIKIFMSDDVCLTSPLAIEQMLRVFQDETVGMAGVLGSRSLPMNGNLLDAPDLRGGVYMPMKGDLEEIRFGSAAAEKFVEDVRFLCPSFFATQFDLAWDESYEGQYYAVLAHCRAMEERSKRLVVPLPHEIWCAYQRENISFEADEKDRRRYFAAYHPYAGEAVFAKDQLALYACGKEAAVEGWQSFSHPEGIAVGARTKFHETVLCRLLADNFVGEPCIFVGDDCTIDACSTLTAYNRIVLENLVTVGANVHIRDYGYVEEDLGLAVQDRMLLGHGRGVHIGCAAEIGANVVIEGAVQIGCGARVRAGSVVKIDIPAYCIAEGNPAHVVKAFSSREGKWLATPDAAALAEVLAEREKTGPLLTYAFITYNRSQYLRKSLRSVLQQAADDPLVEVLVSDNASTDETRALVEEQQKRYKNLRYHCNEKNVGAEGNIHKAIERSRGEYVIVAGDDDYLLNGALRVILDHIRKYRGAAIFHLRREDVPRRVYEDAGIVPYIAYVGYHMTWIGGIAFRRELYSLIDEPQRYDATRLPQVYLQMEMLKKNPKFVILYGMFLAEGTGECIPSGFNFAEVFVKNYLDILQEIPEIPAYLLSDEKKRLMDELVYDCLERIVRYQHDLSLDGIFDIVRDYYGEEPYYEEVVAKMKEILQGV